MPMPMSLPTVRRNVGGRWHRIPSWSSYFGMTADSGGGVAGGECGTGQGAGCEPVVREGEDAGCRTCVLLSVGSSERFMSRIVWESAVITGPVKMTSGLLGSLLFILLAVGDCAKYQLLLLRC